MIAFLDGVLVEGGPEAVVLVGGGIALDLQLSAQSAVQLPAAGAPVRLWTHLAVREDNWSLFGFCDPEERAMFRLLISVAGIGPKVALGMLSQATAADIALYLSTGDEKALTRLPGIGKKGAARLVVELGKRVPELVAGGGSGTSASVDAADGILNEALAVLDAMGLGPAQARQALLKVRQAEPEAAAELESWVRAALRSI